MTNEIGTDDNGATIYAWQLPREALTQWALLQRVDDLTASVDRTSEALAEFGAAYRDATTPPTERHDA